MHMDDWMWRSSEFYVSCIDLHADKDKSCAGITGGKLVPMHEMTEEEFDLVHNIDARGVFLCLREELRIMRGQDVSRYYFSRNL